MEIYFKENILKRVIKNISFYKKSGVSRFTLGNY